MSRYCDAFAKDLLLSCSLPALASLLSRMSCSSTIQGLFVDELGLMPDVGLCDISIFSGLADHVLNSDGAGSVMGAGTPSTGGVVEAGAPSTGGVVLRGGSARNDRFHISQNVMNSVPSSITPFSLIPYLDSS